MSEIFIKRQLHKKYREVAPVKYSFNSKFHQIAPLRLQIEQIRQYYADYSNKMCDITGVGTKMLLPLQISSNIAHWRIGRHEINIRNLQKRRLFLHILMTLFVNSVTTALHFIPIRYLASYCHCHCKIPPK